MALEVTSDLGIKLIDLNYPGIHVYIASNSHFGALLGHGGLQTASKVTSDLGIELSDLNYLCYHPSLASISSNSMNVRRRRPNVIH